MSTKVYIPREFSITGQTSEYESEKKLNVAFQLLEENFDIETDIVHCIRKYFISIEKNGVVIQTENPIIKGSPFWQHFAKVQWDEVSPSFKTAALAPVAGFPEMVETHLDDEIFKESSPTHFLSSHFTFTNTHLLEFYSKLNTTEQGIFYKFLRKEVDDKTLSSHDPAVIIDKLKSSAPYHINIFYMKDNQEELLYKTDILMPRDYELYRAAAPEDDRGHPPNLSDVMYEKVLVKGSAPKIGEQLSSLLDKWESGMQGDTGAKTRNFKAYNNDRLYMTREEIFELSGRVLLWIQELMRSKRNYLSLRLKKKYDNFLSKRFKTHQQLFEILRNNQLYWRLVNGLMIYYISGTIIDYSTMKKDEFIIKVKKDESTMKKDEEDEEEDAF